MDKKGPQRGGKKNHKEEILKEGLVTWRKLEAIGMHGARAASIEEKNR